MNKRVYLLLVPLLITGCSFNSNKKDDKNKNDKGYIKEATTIDFLCMSDSSYRDTLEKIIKDFKEEEPNVTVNLCNPLGSGSYDMIEKTVFAGFFNQDYPDIVQCYPDNVVNYIAAGYALNIDDFLNDSTFGLNEKEKEDYISSFMEEGQGYSVPGTYSLPFCKSTELMYYNADLLIGLELDGINENKPLDDAYLNNLTWEELFDNLCPKLKEKNLIVESDKSSIFTYDSDENLFITLANQYDYGYTSIDEQGKPSVDFDNNEMKELIKTFKKAKDDGYLQTKNTYGNYVSYSFVDKKSLFTVSSTAGLAYNFDKENPITIGVAKIPHAEGREYSSINQGPSVCLLDHKDDNRAKASFLFWKFLTNETNSSTWSVKTGYMGIRNSTYESEEYMQSLNVNDEDLLKAAEAKNRVKISEVKSQTFNTPVFKGSGRARKNVGLLLKDCLMSEDLNSEIDSLFRTYSDDAKSYIK